jgi:uncharacterized repeat protein (TIGR03803 family)
MSKRLVSIAGLSLVACTSTTPEQSATVAADLGASAPYVTVTTVHELTRYEGGHSRAPLLEGADGRFYGVGWAGGPNAGGDPDHSCASNFYIGTDVWSKQCPGSIYAVARTGAFELLHAFGQLDNDNHNPDGYQPVTALTQGADGWIYGVAPSGGEGGFTPHTLGCGTAYRLNASTHAFDTLWNFCSDPHWEAGAIPRGKLIPDGSGGWFGAASGGVNNTGVVFHLVDHAASQIVHFDPKGAANVTGVGPYSSPVFGADGRLYGATVFGGTNNQGAVYAIDPTASTITGLASLGPGPFTGDDKSPFGSDLLADADGWFYGVSHLGGAGDAGFIYRVSKDGAVQILHAFSPISSTSVPRFSNADGARPLGALVEDRYHNLYGTTPTGGANGTGTLYQMSRDGSVFVTLYDFPAAASGEGNSPYAGVIVSPRDNTLWGTTFTGGSGKFGTIYRVSAPLSFAPITGAEPGTVYESAPIRVTAIARPTISIANGEYSVNGAPWSAAAEGEIHTGDTLVVRGTSSSALGERIIVAVSFGHQVTSGFTVTTRTR